MSKGAGARTGSRAFQIDGTWLTRHELDAQWKEQSATRTFFVGQHGEVRTHENASFFPVPGLALRTRKDVVQAARRRRFRRGRAAKVAAVLLLVAVLLGCVDGNSGVTSSGTDGQSQAHIPINGGPCYLIVGEVPVVAHCPTTIP